MTTPEIVCKILNQAGAEIHVLKRPNSYSHGHGWLCTACRAGNDPTRVSWPVETARSVAQKHADTCRFLPA